MSKKFALCGFMGSGKSSVFNGLSPRLEKLGLSCVDSDKEILLRSGAKDIDTYVADNGWEGFRDVEADCISSLVEKHSMLFLSLGGGSLSDQLISLFRLKEVCLIWIKVPFEECIRRCKNDLTARPLLQQMSLDELNLLYLKREALYSQADFVIINESLNRSVKRLMDFIGKQIGE